MVIFQEYRAENGGHPAWQIGGRMEAREAISRGKPLPVWALQGQPQPLRLPGRFAKDRSAVRRGGADTSACHRISRSGGRAEEMVQLGGEDVGIGGRGDDHRGDHASQAHRAQDGEDLPVSLRRPFMDACPAERARESHRHRGHFAINIEGCSQNRCRVRLSHSCSTQQTE